jgi:hypothetical protein
MIATVDKNGAARRYPASSFPQISGIRLAPSGVEAALVNLSSVGMLVECAARMAPGTAATVMFVGSFSPSSVAASVVRSEVAGIGKNGSLSYRIGMSFDQPITLDETLGLTVDHPAEELAPPVLAVEPVTAVCRNRW